MLWTWLGALLVGISLGLLGAGGSILTVPVLVYLADVPEKLAITSSLAIVAAISGAGAVPFARRGDIVWRSVLLFGLPGMAGAALGARLAHGLSASVQLTIFALVMLWAAYGMLRNPSAQAGEANPERRRPSLRIVADGLAIGAMTGVIGVGGGFLILPALTLLGGLALRTAIGTSLVVIALNALVGFVAHLIADASQLRQLDTVLLATFIAIGVAGSLTGQYVGGRLPQQQLRRMFGIVLVLLAAFMLWQQGAAWGLR
ncbi:MAG: sulfite exporter TauE/SafE family protein [Steroidobacteraceae bacterium]